MPRSLPSLRPHLQDAAVTALWVIGATSLALAGLDYLAYDFVSADLHGYEERLHETRRFASGEPASETIPGRAAIVLTGVTAAALLAACLLARIRRLARRFVTIAIVATATLALILTLASAYARAVVDKPEVEPGTGALWLTDRDWCHGDGIVDHPFALLLLTLAIPALALVAIAVARRPATWRIALATAVPATITAGTTWWLSATYGRLHAIGHETWAADVQTTRLALLATAALLVGLGLLLRTRPASSSHGPSAPSSPHGPSAPSSSHGPSAPSSPHGPSAPSSPLRSGPPTALLILGVAAVLATAPHRHAIDTLYPLRDPGAKSLDLSWSGPRAPWAHDVPRAETCAPAYRRDGLFIRLDDGQPILHHDHRPPAPLAHGMALAALHDAFREDTYRTPDEHLALIIDRRVAMTDLVPLLTGLPGHTRFTLTVAGVYTQTLPSADGPVIVWSLCSLGELQVPQLRAADLDPGATWADIVDDPYFVRRPELEA